MRDRDRHKDGFRDVEIERGRERHCFKLKQLRGERRAHEFRRKC